MENKKTQKLSIAALIISILPLATFIPALFNISLPDGVRSAWAGVNILSVIVGLILSTIISGFWVLIIGGIAALALFLNFAS